MIWYIHRLLSLWARFPVVPVSFRYLAPGTCGDPLAYRALIFPALLYSLFDTFCVLLPIVLIQVGSFNVRWGPGVGIVEKTGGRDGKLADPES